MISIVLSLFSIALSVFSIVKSDETAKKIQFLYGSLRKTDRKSDSLK